MFDCRASGAHARRFLIEACFNCFDHRFMFPSGHTPVWARRTPGFDRALLAVRRPVLVYLESLFLGFETPDQSFPGRTLVFILVGVVDKIPLAESALFDVARRLRLG